MSTGPMPYDDDKMPIYALGINIGMQITQQTDFKNLLEEDELEILLAGFGDIVKGENTANPMDVLQKYGPAVNNLLRERMDGILEKVKKDGAEYIDGFLDCNEEAEKTESGLVYYCMKEGDGASPVVEDEVEVILADRYKGNRRQFLVRFSGYGPEADLWLPLKNLKECPEKLEQYWDRQKVPRA